MRLNLSGARSGGLEPEDGLLLHCISIDVRLDIIWAAFRA